MKGKFGIQGDYTSIKDVTKKDKNPFLHNINQNTRINLRKVKRSESYINNKLRDINKSNDLKEESKELRKLDLDIGKIQHKQTSPFVLLYTDMNSIYNRISGSTAITLLFILEQKVGLNSDVIVINPQELVERLGVNLKTSYNIFLELINNKLIDKREDSVWWINPNYFYSGNRLDIRTK